MARKSSLARLSSQVIGPSGVSSNMDLLFEKRVLFFMTWLAIAGVIFWLSSVGTDYWVIVVAFKSVYSDRSIDKFCSLLAFFFSAIENIGKK